MQTVTTMLTALTNFLNSPLGVLMGGAVIAWLFGTQMSSGQRAVELVRLWGEAFATMEMKGKLEKLPGAEKWLGSVKIVNDALTAANKPVLTPEETAAGEKAAERFGWMNKKVD